LILFQTNGIDVLLALTAVLIVSKSLLIIYNLPILSYYSEWLKIAKITSTFSVIGNGVIWQNIYVAY